jgi:protein-S-isoprenylcysteine O-methyltransferase Ste14
MKIIGAAPKIAIPTLIYMLITIFIDYSTKPLFRITEKYLSVLIIIGIILIIIGTMMVINVAIKLQKSFKANILMTDGLYKFFRNPMYVAYLIFIIPGICLLFNSWLVLTSIILNYILLQIFIKEEYKYLEEKFGEEYKIYLSKVWIKFI